MAAEERPLPNAVSVGDELLVAVIQELRGLRADLRRAESQRPPIPLASAGGERELREPKPPAKPAKRASTKKGS